MKKAFPLILLAILGLAAWFLSSGKTPSGSTPESTSASNGGTASTASLKEEMIKDINTMAGESGMNGSIAGEATDADALFDADGEAKPASQVYANAEAALKAVQAGARDYDDMILEQFTLPGEDCTWCPEFYKSVKDLLGDQATPSDQRSYFAEILAVSGKTDNISVLIEGIKNAPSKEIADTYAEALELTAGRDDVVKLVGENLASTNEALREASVAAVTNQGSRLAAELLYKNTVERGDPDGYYSLGIGLGEFVPTEETIPYIQELALKRDQYSHLAVKSLVNAGQQGLQVVFDIIGNSTDIEADRQLLKDSIDHVNYDEETEAFLMKIIDTSKQPLVVEYAKSILEDFNANAAESEEVEDALQIDGEPTPMMSSGE